MRTKCGKFCGETSGSLMVAAALGLTVFLGLAALALDGGHLLFMKNELQRAADAGAMAGARALWPYTLPVPASTQPNSATAQTVALTTATNSYNKVDGASLTSAKVTVQTGRWDYSGRTFSAGTTPVNGVRVVTTATAALYFAQVLGFNPVSLSATGIAIKDFAAMEKPPLPVAINQQMVTAGQQLFIDFYTSGNGGWFIVPPASASSSALVAYVNDNASVAALKMGDIINLSNGQNTTVLQAIADKLAQQNSGQYWDTFLPVVNTSAFNQSQAIVGFVPFRITQVEAQAANKGITGTVLGLDESRSAQPGGNNFGLLAPVKSVL